MVKTEPVQGGESSFDNPAFGFSGLALQAELTSGPQLPDVSAVIAKRVGGGRNMAGVLMK